MHRELGNELKTLFNRSPATDWETLACYEVHAIDATPNERMSAEILADRGVLKAQQKEPVRYGHKYSWLVCLVQSDTSWVALEDLERIGTATTDTKVAAQRVKDLAGRNPRRKVIPADSRYRDQRFCRSGEYLHFSTAAKQPETQPGSGAKTESHRGALRKHGATFQLNAIEREPGAFEEVSLGKQTVRGRVGHKLHFKRQVMLVGSVVCVEFLKEDGSPRYNRPLWLFWTGPEALLHKTWAHVLVALCD